MSSKDIPQRVKPGAAPPRVLDKSPTARACGLGALSLALPGTGLTPVDGRLRGSDLTHTLPRV
jgi:hypothetical protein